MELEPRFQEEVSYLEQLPPEIVVEILRTLQPEEIERFFAASKK